MSCFPFKHAVLYPSWFSSCNGSSKRVCYQDCPSKVFYSTPAWTRFSYLQLLQSICPGQGLCKTFYELLPHTNITEYHPRRQKARTHPGLRAQRLIKYLHFFNMQLLHAFIEEYQKAVFPGQLVPSPQKGLEVLCKGTALFIYCGFLPV